MTSKRDIDGQEELQPFWNSLSTLLSDLPTRGRLAHAPRPIRSGAQRPFGPSSPERAEFVTNRRGEWSWSM
ncbi:hypothetical protein ACS0PU_012035 [Formica fusca]